MCVLKLDECQSVCRASGNVHAVHHLRTVLTIRVEHGFVRSVCSALNVFRGDVSKHSIMYFAVQVFVVEQCKWQSSYRVCSLYRTGPASVRFFLQVMFGYCFCSEGFLREALTFFSEPGADALVGPNEDR